MAESREVVICVSREVCILISIARKTQSECAKRTKVDLEEEETGRSDASKDRSFSRFLRSSRVYLLLPARSADAGRLNSMCPRRWKSATAPAFCYALHIYTGMCLCGHTSNRGIDMSTRFKDDKVHARYSH